MHIDVNVNAKGFKAKYHVGGVIDTNFSTGLI
jgi:hypothetical protein